MASVLAVVLIEIVALLSFATTEVVSRFRCSKGISTDLSAARYLSKDDRSSKS